MKITQKVMVSNKSGLNVKACILLSNVARHFACDLEIADGSRKANPKSLLGLLTIASPLGTKLEISAEGAHAKTAILTLSHLFDAKFGDVE
ncbi:MAG TPA: HPr family phosphocarrier protein [bacterium]|nr:HPr family phosphocarrier protein [bacterium]